MFVFSCATCEIKNENLGNEIIYGVFNWLDFFKLSNYYDLVPINSPKKLKLIKILCFTKS